MSPLPWICLGGAVGSGARYLIGSAVSGAYGTALPGTLAVNVLGSFFLAAIMHLGGTSEMISPTMRLALGTGMMGGFTTYSTFNHETLTLIEERGASAALAYVGLTLITCLAAGMLGLAAARRIAGA